MAAIDIVLLVVAAGAVLLLLYGWSYLRRAAESVEWPRTRGIVVEVSTETFCQTPRGFAPQVEYDYEWEGGTHTSTRVSFGVPFQSSDMQLSQAEFDRFPEGSEVVVHVNPLDASEAVLEPGAVKASWTPLAGGAAILLFVGWVWIGLWLLE